MGFTAIAETLTMASAVRKLRISRMIISSFLKFVRFHPETIDILRIPKENGNASAGRLPSRAMTGTRSSTRTADIAEEILFFASRREPWNMHPSVAFNSLHSRKNALLELDGQG